MTAARQELAERFTEMKRSGLKDMKFFLGQVSEETVEDVCTDVNRVLKMNDDGQYTVLDKWGDTPD